VDADVLVQHDFDDLLSERVVLGCEGERGMANAVILSQPNAPFLVRWLEAYRNFRSSGGRRVLERTRCGLARKTGGCVLSGSHDPLEESLLLAPVA